MTEVMIKNPTVKFHKLNYIIILTLTVSITLPTVFSDQGK